MIIIYKYNNIIIYEMWYIPILRKVKIILDVDYESKNIRFKMQVPPINSLANGDSSSFVFFNCRYALTKNNSEYVTMCANSFLFII